MPSSFQHDPVLTVAASNTTAGAAVKWVAAKNIGESLIILDSGGNGRIGLAGDLDLITLTTNTVTVAGTVAATTLTGAGAGITALAAANITASGTLPALNGAALTALTAANITASGTLPALNGAALTALNGTQVTTGTLPAARIAADSIVEAKLDVSNGPTNGQFLQAQSGEGGGLTWAAAGGGNLILIGTAVASTSATLIVTGLDSTYDTFLILISEIHPTSHSYDLMFRVGDSSGIDSGGSDYQFICQTLLVTNAIYTGEVSAGASSIMISDTGQGGPGADADEAFGAALWLHRPGDGSMQPTISGHYAYLDGSGNIVGGAVFGKRNTVITLDRVEISLTGGNIQTGRMSVFGYKHT